MGSGEDVRTSRARIEGQEHGEDVRTSRLESSGEDVRTSRCQGGQVGARLEEGSLAHLSPVRLSALSSLTRGSGRHGKLKICELFSVPRLTARLNEFDLTATFPAAFDQEVGWQFFDAADRARFWHTLRTQKPDFVMMSPHCKPFSILMNVNWSKMDPEQVKQMQVEGGLQVSEEGLSRKTTGLVTNHLGVAAVLSQYQCSKDHPHVPLEHGLPHKARIYPDDMVKAILTGLTFQDHQSSFAAGFDEEEENDLEDQIDAADTEAIPSTPMPSTPAPVDQETVNLEKEKVRKLHLNMGHLPKHQMLMLLRAAGAKSRALEYTKNQFHCSQCMRQQKPIPRRHAAFPRTFTFNTILGIDVFYISWEGTTLAFLNIVCHGTNFQQVGMIKPYHGGTPDSRFCWQLFNELWIRPFGLPETIITDGGGEFKNDFERRVEQIGVFQVTTDAHSPWQNGRAERHGHWVKEKIEMDCNSGIDFLFGQSQEPVVPPGGLLPVSTCLWVQSKDSSGAPQ